MNKNIQKRVECEICGSEYLKINELRHFSTQKHIEKLNILLTQGKLFGCSELYYDLLGDPNNCGLCSILFFSPENGQHTKKLLIEFDWMQQENSDSGQIKISFIKFDSNISGWLNCTGNSTFISSYSSLYKINIIQLDRFFKISSPLSFTPQIHTIENKKNGNLCPIGNITHMIFKSQESVKFQAQINKMARQINNLTRKLGKLEQTS